MAFTEFNQEAWEQRAVLMCKPEQSGKTFLMIQQIIKDLEDPSEGKTVNFIFCDNSLLLNKQTAERIKRDVPVPEYTINGENYVEFSSRNDGVAQRNAGAVISKIVMNDIRNVICCTNGKRVSDISDMIREFNTSPHVKGFGFKIWLDEADKFARYIQDTFRPLIFNNDNVQLFMLTATPDTLFTKFGEMSVFPLDCTTSEDYHGWKDNTRILRDDLSESTEDFIDDVLSKVMPGPYIPNTKWYVPASTYKRTHYRVRDSLVFKGFAVFVVNGDGLTLSMPGFNVCEKKTEELNVQILRMFHQYQAFKYPVAVTGNICVGRGISIMSPEFIFDYGILSNCSKKAEASQNAGRLKGNIKKWANYKQPTVFTTTKFDKIACEWEEKSRRLATIAFDKQEAGGGTIVAKPEFKGIGSDNTARIPVKVIFHDMDLHARLVELSEKKAAIVKQWNKERSKIFVEGVKNGKVELVDKNKEHKFDLAKRKLKNFRMFTKEEQGSRANRRFKQFSDAHDKLGLSSQACKSDEYNLDFCKDRYDHDGFVNEANVAWITFRI